MTPTREDWEKTVKPKGNWDQLLEQDPELARAWTERSKVLVLKEGELEIHLDYHEYEGNFRYDLRMWAMIDGKMRPTKRGLVIFPQQIQRFVQLLDELINGGDQPKTN